MLQQANVVTSYLSANRDATTGCHIHCIYHYKLTNFHDQDTSSSHRCDSTALFWIISTKKACFHDRELSAASELTGIAFTPSHAVEFAFASSLSEPQAIALLFS